MAVVIIPILAFSVLDKNREKQSDYNSIIFKQVHTIKFIYYITFVDDET